MKHHRTAWTRRRSSARARSGLLLLALGALGCATNPATGRRQLSLISESDEIAMGRQADPEIVASMGLYDDPALQSYVQELGGSLAASSERPGLPWTFRVLDDPVVNAFALPGGYVYVTRGILAHLNSEAELVGVLGHEIGHVTARHSVNQMSKAQLFSIGLGVGMVVSPELRQFGDLAQTGLGLLFLKYSRDDERQADELGLRYSIRGGYDARQMPEVFSVLKRVGEAEGGGRVPGWLSTHPDPENRREALEAQLAGLGHDFSGAKVERASYVRRLDGLVFGEDPRQGFFDGTAFYHPELKFQLDFPDGWKIRNQHQSVSALSAAEDALIELTLVTEEDPESAARTFMSQQGVTGEQVETGRVHGLRAASGRFEAQSGETALAGRVVFVRYDGNTYRLLGYTRGDKWSGYASAVARTQKSFRPLTDRKVLGVQPARLDLVRPAHDLTVEEFQGRYPSSVPLQTVALINHVDLSGGSLAAGLDAKRVVGGR